MNILIKAYTALNFGDDLFVYMLCNRFKEYNFTLYSKYEYNGTFNKIDNLKMIDNFENHNEEEIKIAPFFDAVIYIAGSIFMEYISGSDKKLDELVKISNINKLYIIGSNFGPYLTETYFGKVKQNLIPKLKYITFRDKYSYNLFKESNNVAYAPDIVFGLDYPILIKNKEIGISVIHHLDRKELKSFYRDYLIKIVEIINTYTNKGYIVNLFSFCEKEKDLETIRNILDLLSYEIIQKLRIHKYSNNIFEYLDILSKQEYLVASRFHSLILGLVLDVKVCVISYSNKINNIIKDLELDIYCIDFKNVKKFEVLKIESSYVLDVSKIKEDSKKHFSILYNHLENN